MDPLETSFLIKNPYQGTSEERTPLKVSSGYRRKCKASSVYRTPLLIKGSSMHWNPLEWSSLNFVMKKIIFWIDGRVFTRLSKNSLEFVQKVKFIRIQAGALLEVEKNRANSNFTYHFLLVFEWLFSFSSLFVFIISEGVRSAIFRMPLL